LSPAPTPVHDGPTQPTTLLGTACFNQLLLLTPPTRDWLLRLEVATQNPHTCLQARRHRGAPSHDPPYVWTRLIAPSLHFEILKPIKVMVPRLS
jgi:hypothetical protein